MTEVEREVDRLRDSIKGILKDSADDKGQLLNRIDLLTERVDVLRAALDQVDIEAKAVLDLPEL